MNGVVHLQSVQRGQSALDGIAKKQPRIVAPTFAEIEMKPIRWLWFEYLACGKLHILAGAPGTGKTSLAMTLAAIVTTGGRWPDGTRAQQGNVLVISAEDDCSDTLKPRLLAAGGDPSRVRIIKGRTDENGEVMPFDSATDYDLLAPVLDGVRLIVLDPIVSAVAGDSHKASEVRRALAPWVALAEAHDIAILGISHFGKGSAGRDVTERVIGSQAFGALARVVLATAKDSKADGELDRLLVRSKSNIGPDGGGYRYGLNLKEIADGVTGQYVAFGDPIEGSARDILASAEDYEPEVDDEAQGGLDDILLDLVSNGPCPALQGINEAKKHGYSATAIRTARERLGIKSVKDSMRGGWVWQQPSAHEETENGTKKPKKQAFLERVSSASSVSSAQSNADAETF